MSKLIAIAGKKHSGKSELAFYLTRKKGYKLLSFAHPLKEMLRALGLGDAELYGHKKEVAHKLLAGHTPRYAMQTLGTEWGRQLISPHIWAMVWKEKVQLELNAGRKVVCDDMRFINEGQAVKELGGETILLERTVAANVVDLHPSEDLGWLTPTHLLNNNEMLEDLFRKVDLVLEARG